MKTYNKKSAALFIGLFISLATLSSVTAKVNNSNPPVKDSTPVTITKAEINHLLHYYSLEDESPIANIVIEIYDNNDQLIYSDEVCKKVYDCDERLNLLLNQSDFITEVDNTKIYIWNQ